MFFTQSHVKKNNSESSKSYIPSYKIPRHKIPNTRIPVKLNPKSYSRLAKRVNKMLVHIGGRQDGQMNIWKDASIGGC